jgi:oligopeptide/dipeptide ABC transporter ATP-binding protein
MSTNDALVEAACLTIRIPSHYDDVKLLEEVDLVVRRGEAVGIVGESGSGKSLLGYALIGLPPRGAAISGSVRIHGEEIVGRSERALRGLRGRAVAHIYQDALSSLNPNRTIGNHFADVWRSHRLGPSSELTSRAREVCARLALRNPDRVLASYPHELSGGMRQRVLIGLALLPRPDLLVADEPTTALDRVTARGILDLLRELQVELGMGMVLISHDIGMVHAVCDRIAVLYAGQLCEVGTAEDVIRSPSHRYTKALVDSVSSLRRADYPLATIQGVVPHPTAFPPGCRFMGRCEAGTDECAGVRPTVRRPQQTAWCFYPVQAPSRIQAQS